MGSCPGCYHPLYSPAACRASVPTSRRHSHQHRKCRARTPLPPCTGSFGDPFSVTLAFHWIPDAVCFGPLWCPNLRLVPLQWSCTCRVTGDYGLDTMWPCGGPFSRVAKRGITCTPIRFYTQRRHPHLPWLMPRPVQAFCLGSWSTGLRPYATCCSCNGRLTSTSRGWAFFSWICSMLPFIALRHSSSWPIAARFAR